MEWGLDQSRLSRCRVQRRPLHRSPASWPHGPTAAFGRTKLLMHQSKSGESGNADGARVASDRTKQRDGRLPQRRCRFHREAAGALCWALERGAAAAGRSRQSRLRVGEVCRDRGLRPARATRDCERGSAMIADAAVAMVVFRSLCRPAFRWQRLHQPTVPAASGLRGLRHGAAVSTGPAAAFGGHQQPVQRRFTPRSVTARRTIRCRSATTMSSCAGSFEERGSEVSG